MAVHLYLGCTADQGAKTSGWGSLEGFLFGHRTTPILHKNNGSVTGVLFRYWTVYLPLLHTKYCKGSLQYFFLGGGARTSSKKHVKKLHSVLRYAESLWEFTEIKQVSARSIQVCQGSMGFNAWKFVLRVEHLYIVSISRRYG